MASYALRSTQINTLTDRAHGLLHQGGPAKIAREERRSLNRAFMNPTSLFDTQIHRTDSCTSRRFQSLRNSYTPLFIAHTLILIRHDLTVPKQTIRVHQYSTNTLYGTIQIYCSVQWQICIFITFVAAPGGRSEDFRKDNALIKIQKQINKSTVQTHLRLFPSRPETLQVYLENIFPTIFYTVPNKHRYEILRQLYVQYRTVLYRTAYFFVR